MNGLNLKITNTEKHLSKMPELQNRFNSKEKARLAEAARGFESLLTSMMLKSMTKTTDGMFGSKGFGGDYLDTIFESQLSSYISKRNSLGVADMIYRKITGEDINSLKSAVIEGLDKSEKPRIKINSDSDMKIIPSKGSLKRLDKYDKFIEHASNTYGISKNLIKSVILTESAGNPKAVSKANAKGLMQLMDSTAGDMGVNNVWDPKENILGGSKYLSKMFEQHGGDIKLSLAAYNAGPGNIEKYNGIPPFKETKNYINRVIGYFNYLEN